VTVKRDDLMTAAALHHALNSTSACSPDVYINYRSSKYQLVLP